MPGRRIPLHDHADGNAGGKLAAHATATGAAAAAAGSGSSGAAVGVDVRDDGVSVFNPATVLNFRTGLTADAAGNIDVVPGGTDFPWTDGNALGAVGDGSTNNDTAFAAIQAAVPEGGTAFLRDGIYDFSSTFTWTKSFRLLGASSHPEPNGSTPASVVLRMTSNNTTAIAQSSSSVLSAIENVEILNAGTHTSNRGIYVLGYMRTRNVYVKGFYDGLFIDGISGGPYFCDIDASSFDFNTRAGIYVDGNANNLRIHGGQAADNQYGIYMTGGSSGITIEEINVEVNSIAAIAIDGANGGTDNVTIRDIWADQVSGTGGTDILLGATATVSNVLLENCYLSTNIASATHISSTYVAGLTIVGGHCTNGLGTVNSLVCDTSHTTNVLLLNAKMDGTVTTPATTRIIDATDVTPSSTGGANAVGTSKYLARADHVHNGSGAGPSFATPAIVLGTAAAAGAAGTVIRSDSTIVAFDATAPVTQALGDSAATGSAAVSARRDHKHGMPALSSAAPLVASGSGATGTALPSSREDHVHPASAGTVGVGTYGLLVEDGVTAPPVTLYTEDGTDWVYADG